MKRWLGIAGLVLVGMAGWRVGDLLSSDALSLAIGVLIGVLAGMPAALLLASRRTTQTVNSAPYAPPMPAEWRMAPATYRGQPALPVAQDPVYGDGYAARGDHRSMAAPYGAPPQPPAHAGPMGYAWPPPLQQERVFKVVGEREEWLEEWQ